MTEPVEPVSPLSAKQQAVAQLVADGFTTKQVAARLGLGTHTVRWHLTRIVQAIGGDPQKHSEVVVAQWWWRQHAA